MNEAPIDVDAYAAAFGKAKAHKDKLDEQIKAVKADMEQIKEILLNHMSNNNLKSLETTDGDSMHTRSTLRYSSGDWTHFKAWVLQNPDAIELFENRLHQGNVAIWLKENEGNTAMVPPGLSSHTTTTLVVKPAKKA